MLDVSHVVVCLNVLNFELFVKICCNTAFRSISQALHDHIIRFQSVVLMIQISF